MEVLQEQLQAAKDQLQVSRRREEALQQQVELQLEEESGERGGHGMGGLTVSCLS